MWNGLFLIKSATFIQKTFLGSYNENLVKNILQYFAMNAPIYEFDKNIKKSKNVEVCSKMKFPTSIYTLT